MVLSMTSILVISVTEVLFILVTTVLVLSVTVVSVILITPGDTVAEVELVILVVPLHAKVSGPILAQVHLGHSDHLGLIPDQGY